jgi:hypothetical protein
MESSHTNEGWLGFYPFELLENLNKKLLNRSYFIFKSITLLLQQIINESEVFHLRT